VWFAVFSAVGLHVPGRLQGQPLADGGRPVGNVLRTGFEVASGPEANPPRDPREARAAVVRREDGPSDGEGTSKALAGQAGQADPIPLAPPGHAGQQGKEAAKPKAGLDVSSLVTVGSSLAVVLGLFFVLAWVMRRTTPGNCPALPNEVFEVLGRAPLAARQQAHLVRLGAKLVLLSISPGGVEALSEVTDPDEVNRLAGLCQRARPDSTTAAFRQVFQRFTKDHPADRPLEAAREGLYRGTKGTGRGAGGGLEGADV
jgi:flagellar biogenesis protein FliO